MFGAVQYPVVGTRESQCDGVAVPYHVRECSFDQSQRLEGPVVLVVRAHDDFGRVPRIGLRGGPSRTTDAARAGGERSGKELDVDDVAVVSFEAQRTVGK